jgi:hypothetical protein
MHMLLRGRVQQWESVARESRDEQQRLVAVEGGAGKGNSALTGQVVVGVNLQNEVEGGGHGRRGRRRRRGRTSGRRGEGGKRGGRRGRSSVMIIGCGRLVVASSSWPSRSNTLLKQDAAELGLGVQMSEGMGGGGRSRAEGSGSRSGIHTAARRQRGSG